MFSQVFDFVPSSITNIFYIGAGILAVSLSLVSLYVLFRAVHIVLLVMGGGVGALRVDLQNRNFERRYRTEQRRTRQAASYRRRELAYRAWKMNKRRY